MTANDLGHRLAADGLAKLELAGPDARTFLQGYLTCDLDALRDGVALPAAYCNIKGRVLANGWAGGTPDRVDLYVHATVCDGLSADLAKYLMFAKSKLTRAAARFELDAHAAADGGVVLEPFGWRLFERDTATPLEPWDALLVENGIVLVTAETSERFLPQMLGLTAFGTVSFSKGCYLGQEVVARAEHRGEVKRRLARYRAEAAAPAAAIGADVEDVSGRAVGTVVGYSPSNGSLLIVTAADDATLLCAGAPLSRFESAG